MGKPLSSARRAAWQLLGDIRRREGRARDMLRTSERLSGLDARDRALVDRLVLGVTQTQGTLDTQLKRYLLRPSELEPRVRDALRLATYELLWMSTPEAVAVSQGVELVRLACPRAARMANAVLHKVAAQAKPACARAQQVLAQACAGAQESQLDEACLPDVKTMSLACGLPSWLVEQVQLSQGKLAAAHFAYAQLARAPIWVSTDPAQLTPAALEERLTAAGLPFDTSCLPDTYKLARAAGLSRVGTVGQDLIASDFAARLVALIATPQPGQHLLEIGQGRATKTLLMQDFAQQLGGPFYQVGVDSVAYKTKVALARLATNWGRWCTSLTFDGLKLGGNAQDAPLPPELKRSFDTVFLDAPCSGTGTLRRHPEICWSLKANQVLRPDSGLPQLQLALLCAASVRVRLGGELIYSTCSVLSQENTQVVEAFLNSSEGQNFQLANPLDAPAVKASAPEVQALIASNLCADKNERSGSTGAHGAYFQSTLEFEGCDGHFCARLVRTS